MVGKTDAYLVIDVGGSHVKYGAVVVSDAKAGFYAYRDAAINVGTGGQNPNDGGLRIVGKNSKPTPKSWSEMSLLLKEIKTEFPLKNLVGAALSVPGAIDPDKGIAGISAVGYFYNRNIKTDVENVLQLPVEIENDANCAALGEVWKGAAQGVASACVITVGTGIGGAFLLNGKLHRGANFAVGNAFGSMFVHNVDGVPTPWWLDVSMTFLKRKVAKIVVAAGYGTDADKAIANTDDHDIRSIIATTTAQGYTLDGIEIFNIHENIATQANTNYKAAVALEVDKWYTNMALGLISLQEMLDPEVIIIGGGISSRQGVVAKIAAKVEKQLNLNAIHAGQGGQSMQCNIVKGSHSSDAQLIGALYNYIERR